MMLKNESIFCVKMNNKEENILKWIKFGKYSLGSCSMDSNIDLSYQSSKISNQTSSSQKRSRSNSANFSQGFSTLDESKVFKFLRLEDLDTFIGTQKSMIYDFIDLQLAPRDLKSKVFMCLNSYSHPFPNSRSLEVSVLMWVDRLVSVITDHFNILNRINRDGNSFILENKFEFIFNGTDYEAYKETVKKIVGSIAIPTGIESATIEGRPDLVVIDRKNEKDESLSNSFPMFKTQ